jgi:myo-inositol-1-phosphate synthase
MNMTDSFKSQPLLLIVAGAKGAVGSTLAVVSAAMSQRPESILPSLTTAQILSDLLSSKPVHMVGWDLNDSPLLECIKTHGVLAKELWEPYESQLDQVQIHIPPKVTLDLRGQVEILKQDILAFKAQYPHAKSVLINLLPAAPTRDLNEFADFSQLYSKLAPEDLPDLPYIIASIHAGVPIVNFTPNQVEIPLVIKEAIKQGVPISGRDGKTGQTYLKVVLASALKARNLIVDGWYSLNILGNQDGKNLMDPHRAAGKLSNKTDILDDIMGYQVGERYGVSSHKVQIDYYPPRGDAKEAWDVIDFLGVFGLPMSMRLNLQVRDSVLAAPLVLDLARWMIVLQMAGCSGPVPELAFYYKKPVGHEPPLSFQDQVAALRELGLWCHERIMKDREQRAAASRQRPADSRHT